LTARGYSVIATDNGKDALRLAKSERPDIIILDIFMPHLCGGEVARILKEAPETENIPVIYISGRFEEHEVGRLGDGKMVFRKPYKMDQLGIVIKRLLSDENKILIVDDEKDALFMLEKELAARGYSIVATDNGNDALVLAKSEHPDLIILDICMPGMDGPEVAAKLKEDAITREAVRPFAFLRIFISSANCRDCSPPTSRLCRTSSIASNIFVIIFKTPLLDSKLDFPVTTK